MQPSEIKAFFRKQIEAIRDDFVKDLDALSDEQLAASPGGVARSALDMTYEVGIVNRRIAMRLRGETPEPWKFEGWVMAPDAFKTREAARAHLISSMDEILAAWDALPDSDVNKVIPTPTGQTSPMDLAFMAAYHTGYHDAQLNYIQSLHGDDKMHWG